MKLQFLLFTFLLSQFQKTGVAALLESENEIRAQYQMIDSSHRARILNEEVQPKIIGGKPVDKGSYPSYAIPITGSGLCGATLIHNDILLSAGHCSGIFKGNDIAIGASVLSGDDATEIIRAESELVNPDFSASSLRNDSLLIKLEKATDAPLVKWNTDSSYPVDGDTVRVIGFGLTAENGQTSNALLEVSLEIVDFKTCSAAYRKAEAGTIVESSMICAGPPSDSEEAADSCQGDSGGPLFDSSGLLVGIVSFGYGCGERGIPGVYTRVSSVSKFIKNGICQLSASPPTYCSDLDNGGNHNTGDNGNGDTTGDATIVPTGEGTDVPSDDETFVPTASLTPSSQPDNFDPTGDTQQCDEECTVAWIVSGLVLHKGNGSSCKETCAVWYADSYLADGYECGACAY